MHLAAARVETSKMAACMVQRSTARKQTEDLILERAAGPLHTTSSAPVKIRKAFYLYLQL
jgi:hypothetical protein